MEEYFKKYPEKMKRYEETRIEKHPEKKYSIIFTAEELIPKVEEEEEEEALQDLERKVLPFIGKDWDETERDCELSDIEDYSECKVKINAILNEEQFKEFIDEYDLSYEGETIGAIGSRAFGVGWSPAICFVGGSKEITYNAYITPYLETKAGKKTIPKELFEELKEL
jgi:hypothetical protein